MNLKKTWLADPWNREKDWVQFLFQEATNFEVDIPIELYGGKIIYERSVCFTHYWNPES